VQFKTREVATLYLSSIVDDSASFGYGPRGGKLFVSSRSLHVAVYGSKTEEALLLY